MKQRNVKSLYIFFGCILHTHTHTHKHMGLGHLLKYNINKAYSKKNHFPINS
jgi:hypothetical protein